MCKAYQYWDEREFIKGHIGELQFYISFEANIYMAINIEIIAYILIAKIKKNEIVYRKNIHFNIKLSNKSSHSHHSYWIKIVFFRTWDLLPMFFCLTSDEIFPLLNGCTCEQSVACKCFKYVTMKQHEIQYIWYNAWSLLFNNTKG